MDTQNTTEQGASTGSRLAGSTGYPLRSLEEFAGWLMSCGIIDECAYWDAENYDGGRMIARMERALAKVADND